MDKTIAVKRINNAVKKLNCIAQNLKFSFLEEYWGLELICNGRDENTRFGAFENIEFFEDFKEKRQAYDHMAKAVELIVQTSALNDPKAYHNYIA